MKTKSKTALIATFVIASATSALAGSAPSTFAEVEYLRSPNAPVPYFQEQTVRNRTAAPLIEGRNVGLGARAAAPLNSEDVWLNRNDYIRSNGGY